MKPDLSDSNNLLTLEIRKHLGDPDLREPQLASAMVGGFINGFLYAMERIGPMGGRPASDHPAWLTAIVDRMHAEAGDILRLRDK